MSIGPGPLRHTPCTAFSELVWSGRAFFLEGLASGFEAIAEDRKMSLRGIASLGFKLLGIFVIVQAVPLLQDIGIFLGSIESLASTNVNIAVLIISAILPVGLLIGIGCGLLIFSSKLASRLITPDTEGPRDPSADSEDIQAVAFSVIGVLVFVLAVPKLFQIGANYYGIKQMGQYARAELFWRGTWVHVIGLLVQLLIGLGLFLGARGLSNFWQRLQTTRPMRGRDS